MIQALRTWRARRAERQAEYWQAEARRCALLARDLDPMREPMRWARLQNRVNWARYNARAAVAKATGSTA